MNLSYDLNLTWDGSYLGEFSEDSIKIIKLYENLCYIKFNDQYCILADKATQLNCVFDEIKVLFNLPKTGTHWFKIKTHIKIIYKPNLDKENNLIYDEKLTKDDQSIYQAMIRNMMAYRYMFKFKSIKQNDLRIRNNNLISIDDAFAVRTYDFNRKLNISSTYFDLVFTDKTPQEVVKSMLEMRLGYCLNQSEMENIRLNYRIKFQEIINRIDKDMISFENDIFACFSKFLNINFLE